MTKNLGSWIGWLLILGTLVFFGLAKWVIGFEDGVDLIHISQLFSLLGIALLSWSMVLSSRWRKLDEWFGGFDKVYKQHHLVGILAFVFIIHHPLLIAIEILPNIRTAWIYLWFSTVSSYNFGVAALYLMILLLVLTLLVNMPYRLWKKTHEYMGLAFLLSSIHILTVSSDVSTYMPLRIWVTFLIGVGLLALFHKKIWYEYLEDKYWYRVSKIEKRGEVIDVWIKPEGKGISYIAGQFVFVAFKKFGGESHPFSIANSSGEEIRLGIKKIG